MHLLGLLPAIVCSALASGDGLAVGEKAPPFRVEAMLKGKAVDLSKGLHVVEFWATWCDDCHAGVPHMNEMVRRYRGKVDFVGVDVWENGDDALKASRRFVRENGSKFDYPLAFDGAAQAMADGYLKAAGVGWIPTAFLVKEGRVLWIGDPKEGLEETIESVLAQRYDPAAARAAYIRFVAKLAEEEKKAMASSKAQQAAQKAFEPVHRALREKDYDGAAKAFDQVRSDDPEFETWVVLLRFNAAAKLGGPRLAAAARALLASNLANDNPTLRFEAKAALGDPGLSKEARALLASEDGKDAWQIANAAYFVLNPEAKLPDPDYRAALTLAEAAVKRDGGKIPDLLSIYALALAKAGRIGDAIDAQTKAISRLKPGEKASAARLKPFEDRLAEYRKAQADSRDRPPSPARP